MVKVFLKRGLALFIVSVMLILPLASCVDESVSAQNSDKASQSADTEKGTEAATDETKESEKSTEATNNGELNNGNENNENNNNDNTTGGDDNTDDGDDNTIDGDDNTTDGDDNTIDGDDNTTDGDDNITDGDDNTTDGDDNTTDGDDNTDDGDDDTTGDGGLGDFVPEVVYHTVSYVTDGNGYIDGDASQQVEDGGASYPVKAVANEGYVFAGWSDGNKSDVRSESNVRKDISISPIFFNCSEPYTICYETRMGGKVIDRVEAQTFAMNLSSYTAPNAPLGYTYGKWSDGRSGKERVDNILSRDETFVLNIVPLSVDNVPTIEIMINDGTGINDRINYKDCTVTLSNTDEEDCFENVSAQLRGRGNSSWSYPKKGFKLKFDKKRTMLGSEHKAKSWIFISNYGDKSLLRNMIGYDMSAAMSGLEYTVMHEFIDVYVNNEYYGLFMMTDKIDVGNGRVDLDKTIYDDPSKMAYILEVGASTEEDRNQGLVVKNVDYFTADRDKGRSYFISFPETDDPAYVPEIHLTYIKDYLDQCLLALSDKNWEKICELMDIESFIDYYIIQELYMNKDGFWRSVHFYKEPNGKLHAGPIWDLDQGLGNVSDLFGVYDRETTPTTDISYVNSSYNKSEGALWIASCNTWYRRLVRNEEFKELLRARLKEIEPIVMKAIASAGTDGTDPNSYYAVYGNAMERNFERWKIMGSRVWPNTKTIVDIKTVKGQIDYIREWMIERYDVLCDFYGVTS